MANLIKKQDITSVLDAKRNGTFNAEITWTRNNPPHTSIASWFENSNGTEALVTGSNPIRASDVINSITTFVSKFANYRKVTYVQQYTNIRVTTKGEPMGETWVVTEWTGTAKSIISSTGASKGGVTYKPTLTADALTVSTGKTVDYEGMVASVNSAITRWTNNYNSVVTLTYNRGTQNWTNHSQRGRR